MLKIQKESKDKKMTFFLEGRLDAVTSPDLENELKAVTESVEELVLDLEKLDYISSAGLRVLLSAHKAMNMKGSMKLVHVGGSLMEIFEVTGFSDILTIE